MVKIFRLALAGVVFLSLIGCSDDEAPAETQVTAELSPLVDHIPADTPYVAANLEPIPDEVMDKMWVAVDPMLAFAQQQLTVGLERLNRQELDREEQILKAVLSELDGKLSRQGLESLGLNFRYFAIYSDGLLPTIRISLSDGQAFQAALDRIETASGSQFMAREAGGQPYYDLGDEKARLLISPQADQLVMTLTPAADVDAAVATLVGATRPSEDAEARLRRINDDYGLLPAGTVLVDIPAIFDRMVDENSPRAAALFGELQAEMTPVCRAEIRGLLENVPRLVSGNRVLTADRVEQLTVVELEPTLATRLQSVTVPMRGMAPMDRGAFYFAFGLNLMELKKIALERVTARAAQPFQCPRLARFNQQLEQSKGRLAQPMPPFVGNLQGLRVLVEDLQIAAGRPQATGMAVLAMDNPQLILGMAQAFVPELAQLEVPMDGTPVALPSSLVQGQAAEPHVAMMGHGIGFSVGAGQAAQLRSFLDAPAPPDPTPVLAFSYDAARFAELQQQMLDRQAGMFKVSADQEATPETTAPDARTMMELNDALRAYYAVFGRISGQVFLTPRGIEMTSTTTLN